ncbi:MAG: DEAD/DEAH box helicase [Cytophagales bacterium]|nr:MAG: DEAD/DEAH box helicase [Cytophagales bacterium]
MKVSTSLPFRIVYSLLQHEYLGYIFEAYAVQVDQNGNLTLKHQHISAQLASEFSTGIDKDDEQLLKLIDRLQQDDIVKKFYNKKVTANEFFLKVFHKEKGDTLLQEAIHRHIEDIKAEILPLLERKLIFEMGNDGEPTYKQLFISTQKATVLFHFMRNEDNTHYFPTIKCGGERIDFQYQNSIIVCNAPAWLLVNQTIYHFEKEIDGNKIKPFLNKKFIIIPRKVEETYFEKFVTPLIAAFDVHSKGFAINNEQYELRPIITFSELPSTKPALINFGDIDTEEQTKEDSSAKIVFSLSFQYGNFVFTADTKAPCFVKMEKTPQSYIFHKVKRQQAIEQEIIEEIQKRGLILKHGKSIMDKAQSFFWLNQNKDDLITQGYQIRQNIKDDKKYFIGSSTIQVEVQENNDWFDIMAIIKFGNYEIPFIQLRQFILQKKSEIKLPNGEIAIIPEEWFARYSELFAYAQGDDEKQFILQKHHLSLVQELQSSELAKVNISKKLEQLRNFEEIEDSPLPDNFLAQLRPYQKAGYNWMQFLNKYNFGGCLADDMGLGKTVQTLAILQSQKEQGNTNPSLLIMPTSLVYNWEMEAKKFTPQLQIYKHTGSNRAKTSENFDKYDLILTSYGTTRADIELLKNFFFNYIILDESQAIKNPDSNIAKAVKGLKCKNKLILTGTPIENSTLDLWSQMNFVNPGLLGNENFFRQNYLNSIEKKHDEKQTKKLYNVIKPFILRRQKSQVATDLPPKIENIHYSEMSELQSEHYEKVKSSFRNEILTSIDEKGIGGSQILLLQGLTKLRQIANHPVMVENDYKGNSGKMDDVLHMIENALTNGHKILIFSQFVKHLTLFKKAFDNQNLLYAYLDGATKNRQEQVEYFQQNTDVKIFLISLKAGGVGLNLTAADFVFLLDPWWNPAVEAQAVDRAYRIGQRNTVFTYKFITRNTVEEKILQLQLNKQKLANNLITTEESFVKNLSKEDIFSIFD